MSPTVLFVVLFLLSGAAFGLISTAVEDRVSWLPRCIMVVAYVMAVIVFIVGIK